MLCINNVINNLIIISDFENKLSIRTLCVSATSKDSFIAIDRLC